MPRLHFKRNQMAKNRKTQSAAARFGPAIKAFLLCLFIGGSGVGYVWQKQQIHYWSNEIKKREQVLKKLQNQNSSRADQIAMLISPKSLDTLVKQLNLGLTQPPPSQIERLIEVPAMPPAVPGAQESGALLTQAR